MKQRKKTAVLIAVIAGVLALLVAGGIGLAFLLGGFSGEESVSREDVVLYWNVDRALYEAKDEDGLTSRKPNDRDGYYHILLAGKGVASYRRVKSKILASRMDSMNLMSLVLDENGLVADILPVEEVTGGIAANCFYVEKVENNVVTAWSSGLLKGVKEEFTITKDTKIYDVSTSTGENAGMATILQKMDRIIAVRDYDGNISHVWVFQRETSSVKERRYCSHCDEEVEWNRWIDNRKLPTNNSGHFLLMNDVALEQQQNVTMGQEIVLDLNGKTVTGKENSRVYAMFEENCVLTILDSSEDQTGKMIATGTKMEQQGCVIWVRYGTFTLYSGTLDASQVNSLQNATCMAVEQNSVANLFGGTLIGGTSTCNLNAKGKNRGGWGGTVNVLGQMNMYGGTISGGTVISRYLKENDSYQRGNGGAVCLDNGAVFNMSGGTITGGKAELDGGNIYIKETSVMTISGDAVISAGETLSATSNGGNIFVKRGGTLNIEGGTIEGGLGKNIGANIYSNGTINMSGGEIYGGKGKENNAGANIHMVNAIFNMSGGRIHGLVEVAGKSVDNPMTATFSGTAQIYSDNKNTSGLRVGKDCPIYVTELQSGAKISVTAEGTFSHKTARSNVKYFISDEGVDINYINGCLSTAQLSCLCGSSDHFGDCDGKQQQWLPWTKDTTLPTQSGYWFLTHDVTLKNAAAIRTEETVYIDLNGKQVVLTANEGGTNRVFHGDPKNSFSLTVTDSSKDKTGTIRAEVCSSDVVAGKLVWLRDGNQQVTIYGGTWDASGVSLTGKNGAAMYAAEGTSLTIHGGTVLGGSATRGGGIYTQGEFLMTGGVIQGGIAAAQKKADGTGWELGNGGNLCAGGKAQITITGGQILNGHADGAGGNLWLGDQVVVTMEKATVSGGTVGNAEKELSGSGGNIRLMGTMTMQDVMVSGGEALGNSGGVYIDRSGVLTAFNSTFEKGVAHGSGGNIALYGSMTLTGCTVKEGVKISKTGNVDLNSKSNNLYVNSGSAGIAKLTLVDTVIAGGVEISNNSGNESVVIVSGQTRITGGKHNLSLPDNYCITISEAGLSGDAMIGITTSAEMAFAVVQQAEGAEDVGKFFASDNDALEVSYESSKLYLRGKGHRHCVCANSMNDHSCSQQLFIPWGETDSEKNSLPTATGCYYLTSDIDLKNAWDWNNRNITLCLNGHTVTGAETKQTIMLGVKDNADLSLNTTLNITDCQGTGVVRSSAMQQGCVLRMRKDPTITVNIYGGTLDGQAENSTQNGGAILVDGGKLYLYNGIIDGTDGDANKNINGGAINLNNAAEFYMYGGRINGGQDYTRGGAVALSGADSRFYMYGGSIIGGAAKYGNAISAVGQVLIDGGTVDTAGEYTMQINKGSFTIVSGTFAKGLRIMNQDLYTAIPEGSICTVDGETVEVTESTVRLNGKVVITKAEDN